MAQKCPLCRHEEIPYDYSGEIHYNQEIEDSQFIKIDQNFFINNPDPEYYGQKKLIDLFICPECGIVFVQKD